MTFWLMMLHHHTKFAHKMFCGSEDTNSPDVILCGWLGSKQQRTNICHPDKHFTHILNFRCDLELERSNIFFHKTLQLMMLYYQTKFGCIKQYKIQYYSTLYTKHSIKCAH